MVQKAIVPLLKPLDLMPPSRSTLGGGAMGSMAAATLQLKDIKEDMASIGWEECPVSSVMAVRCGVATVEEAVAIIDAKKKRNKENKKKRKLVSIAAMTATWGMKKRRNGVPPTVRAHANPLLMLADRAALESESMTS